MRSPMSTNQLIALLFPLAGAVCSRNGSGWIDQGQRRLGLGRHKMCPPLALRL